MGIRAIGTQTFTIAFGEIKSLTIPAGARYAIIVCEPDATATNKTNAVRYTATGIAPTATEGIPFGVGQIYEVRLFRFHQLKNFKVTGVQADKIHTIQVQFYK